MTKLPKLPKLKEMTNLENDQDYLTRIHVSSMKVGDKVKFTHPEYRVKSSGHIVSFHPSSPGKNDKAFVTIRHYDSNRETTHRISKVRKIGEMVSLGSINLGPQPTASAPPAGTPEDNEKEFQKKLDKKEFLPKLIKAKIVRKESSEMMKESPDYAVRVSSTSDRDLVKAFYELSRKGQTNASLWIFSDVKVAADGMYFFDVRNDEYDQFFGAKQLEYLLPPNTSIKDIPASEAQVRNDAGEDITDKSPSSNTIKGAEMSGDLRIHPLVVEHLYNKQSSVEG